MQFSPVWEYSQYRNWPEAAVSPELNGTGHRNERESKEEGWGRRMEGLSSRNNLNVLSIAITKLLKFLLTKNRRLFTSQIWKLQGQGCTATFVLPFVRAPLVE